MNNLDDLQKASRLGDVQMLRKVLATSSDLIDEIDSKLGWAPIYRTVICGHYEATEFLLKSGADPDIQNRLGETALHQAADSNQLKIAQCLLKYKANTNVKQNDGETALHHCSSKGHLKMVKLLLKHKADPNIQNLTYGKTCLHYAADNGNLAIVQALLSYQAKTDIPDRNNKLPIDYAQNLDIIEALAANSSIEPKNLFNEDIPPATFKVPGLKEFPIVNESNEELVEFFAENTQKILEKDEVVVMFNSESLLEPESERISINSTPQERHFSFGGDLNKNALYK